MHWIDRHPKIFTLVLLGLALATLASVVYGVVRLAKTLAG